MDQLHKNIKVPEQFADISPIDDADVPRSLQFLVKEPMFKHLIKAMIPGFDFKAMAKQLAMLRTKDEFQMAVMHPFLKMVEAKTTSGITTSGGQNLDSGHTPHVFISNHRDIVLDASLLNMCLLRHSTPTCEVAIGDNLLVFKWIDVLVRINKSFIVKRNLPPRQVLLEARHLSEYINHTVTQRRQSLWIAQRQGRTKDSNDFTQESLLKMLTIGNSKPTFVEKLMDLNLLPVTISYEYDPNDYLKAQEHLNKVKNPDFKKSKKDDLESMQVGISKFKGHVHYAFAPCINDQLAAIPKDLDKQQIVIEACKIVDRAIHSNYKFYPANYIAYDEILGGTRFASRYTEQQKQKFNDYLNGQADKVAAIETAEDREMVLDYMRRCYANPLINHLKAFNSAD